MTENNKKKMPITNRESISFLDSSILDSSNSDKLVQFIREKRGLRNAQPIFLNPSANNSKRESFPIEIESVKRNENNKNSSNVDPPPLTKNNEVIAKASSARVSLRRLSHNLIRRVLDKEFEQTIPNEQFCPAASSTPIQEVWRNNDNDNDNGRISNIPQDLDGDSPIVNSLQLQKEISPKFDENNTAKHAKTMSASVLTQTEKGRTSEPTNNCIESIAVDDRAYENEEQETLTNKRQRFSTKYNEEELIEETLINRQNISQPQLQISHPHDVLPSNTNNPNAPLLNNKSRKEDSLRQNITNRMPAEKINKEVQTNRRAEDICTNILDANTSKQQQVLPSAELNNDASIKNQQQSASRRSSILIIPVYPPACSNEIERVPVVDKSRSSPRKRSYIQSPAPTSNDDIDKQQQKSNVSRKKQRSKRSTRSLQPIEAEMTSDDDVASDNRAHVEELPNNRQNDVNQSGARSRRSRQQSLISEENSSSPNNNVNPVLHAQPQQHSSVNDEIQNFLNKVSDAPSVKLKCRKPSNCSGIEPLEPLLYRSISCESMILEDDNEHIIEPFNGLSTSKHGIVYDMSPRSGRKWVDSIIKTKGSKKSVTAVRRTKSFVSKNTEPATLIYENLSSGKLHTFKNSTVGNNRRKLYSKGRSDNESSFEHSPEKSNEISRHMQDSTQTNMLKNQLQNVSKVSLGGGNKDKKLTKKRKNHLGSKTIRTMQPSDNESDHIPRNAKEPPAVTVDDNEIFKIPERPVPTSKKNIGMSKSVSRKPLKSKMSLVSNSRSNNNYNGRSSSSDISTATEDSFPEYAKSVRSNGPSNERVESSTCSTKETSNLIQKERRSVISNAESVETEIIQPRAVNSKKYKSKNKQPVDPDDAEKIHENSPTTSENIISKRKNTLLSEDPQPSTSLINNWQNDDEIETGETVGQLKNINEHIAKDINKNKKSAKKAANKSGNTKKNHSALQSKQNNVEVINENENETHSPKRKNEKNSKSSASKSKKIRLSDTAGSEINPITGLRRSTRKHRPPRAYWTSRRDLDRTEICYTATYCDEDNTLPKKKEKLKTNRKISNKSDATVERSINLNASQQLADDLFGVSINCNIPPTIQESNEEEVEPNNNSTADDLIGTKKKKKKRNIPETIKEIDETEMIDPNYNATAREETEVPSSANPNSEPNFNKEAGAISWLQDLIKKTADSSSGETLKTIYNLSNIKIAPGNELVFRDIGGVHYAFYNQTPSSTNGHGFMRLNPMREKSLTKAKDFNLVILNLVGAVQLLSNQKQQTIKNGDLVTVPKETFYSLKNISRSEPALLFFTQYQ